MTNLSDGDMAWARQLSMTDPLRRLLKKRKFRPKVTLRWAKGVDDPRATAVILWMPHVKIRLDESFTRLDDPAKHVTQKFLNIFYHSPAMWDVNADYVDVLTWIFRSHGMDLENFIVTSLRLAREALDPHQLERERERVRIRWLESSLSYQLPKLQEAARDAVTHGLTEDEAVTIFRTCLNEPMKAKVTIQMMAILQETPSMRVLDDDAFRKLWRTATIKSVNEE